MPIAARISCEHRHHLRLVVDHENVAARSGRRRLAARRAGRERPPKREGHHEAGAAARAFADRDGPAMGSNDAMADGQAETGAGAHRLGGEEGLEDPARGALPARRGRCPPPRLDAMPFGRRCAAKLAWCRRQLERLLGVDDQVDET